jgi:uncharacterized protein YfeS
MQDEHDPWNDETLRHPRARELMAFELWDCVDEAAPFGSDEGSDAYYEYRRWRSKNAGQPLVACIEWIGDEEDYDDEFTYDATIIATVLGQLVDEGRIDADAKPYAQKAIARQLESADEERSALLRKVAAAVTAG